MEDVKVYGFWYSPYSKKVEIALKLKGVDYEYIEEDRHNKSEQLLKYNPIHKKVPVFIHDGKPLAESLVILEYIDETWKGNPILPTDPYDRAQARFWAKFIDDKLNPTMRSALMTQGKEGEKLDEEAEQVFKILENEIKGKEFFGGNEIGFVDIVAIVVALWLPVLQEAMGKELITKEKYPGILAWTDRLLACDVIQEKLTPKDKMIEFYRARFAPMRDSN